jgi:hypothetical protein
MGLFTPAWKSKNKEKALRAIEKMTDQKKLAKVAKTAESWEVRKRAVWKITDQSMLVDVAKNDGDSRVRKAAVEELTDQSALADIAKNDKDSDVRKAAVEKLTDKSALADVAKNGEDWNVAIVAYKRLGLNTDITAKLSSLINGSYSARKNSAIALIQLLKNDHKSASFLWKRVSEKSRTPHLDEPDTILECGMNMEDGYDTGIGIEFPPYPFND